MAASTWSLAAHLSVTGASTAASQLGVVHKATQQTKSSLQSLKDMGGHLKTALQGVGALSAVAAGGMGFMAKQATEFEHAMAKVASVIGGKTNPNYREMEFLSKKIASTTIFTTAQVAEGVEEMAKAGLSTKEISNSLRATMSLAAIEGLSTAQSVKIVTSNMAALGIESSKADAFMDTMAYTSMATITSVHGLGEALRYGAASARMAKMDWRETIAVLGALSQAGQLNTVAGTAFSNMLQKLAAPTKAAQKLMKEYKIEMLDTTGKFKPWYEIIPQFAKLEGAQKTVLKSMGAMKEIFGMRGMRAAEAMIGIEEADPGKLKRLIDGAKAASSATKGYNLAMLMAEERTNSWTGATQKLKSAMSLFSTAFLDGMISNNQRYFITAQRWIVGISAFLDKKLTVRQRGEMLSQFGFDERTKMRMADIAAGIRKGLNEVTEAFKKAYEKGIKPFINSMGTKGESSVGTIARVTTKAFVGLAAIGPILLALSPILMAFGGAAGVAFKAISMFGGKGGPLKSIIMIGLVESLGKGKTQTERLASGLQRVAGWLAVITVAAGKMANALGPLGTLAVVAGGGAAVRGARGAIGGAVASWAARRTGLGGVAGGAAAGLIAGAQPVWVVNWPGGPLGALAGAAAPGVVGGAGTAAAGAAGGGLTRALGGGLIAGGLARVGGWLAPAAAGAAMPTGIGAGLMAGGAGATIGGVSAAAGGGMAGALAVAGPVAAAALVGVALGRLANTLFDTDNKISNWMMKPQMESQKVEQAIFAQRVTAKNALEQMKMYEDMQRRGVTMLTSPTGEKTALTQEFVMQRTRDVLSRAFEGPALERWMSAYQTRFQGFAAQPTRAQGIEVAWSALQKLNADVKRVQADYDRAVKGGQTGKMSEARTELERLRFNIEQQKSDLREMINAFEKEAKKPLTVSINLDGKQMAEIIARVQKTEAERGGQRPEGKAAPSQALKP